MARKRKIPDGVRHPATVTQQEATPDETAVLEVMQTTPVYTRERDMALLELSDEQLKLYMELLVIPGKPEIYRESRRGYWAYIDSHQDIYEANGTPRRRRHMQTK